MYASTDAGRLVLASIFVGGLWAASDEGGAKSSDPLTLPDKDGGKGWSSRSEPEFASLLSSKKSSRTLETIII